MQEFIELANAWLLPLNVTFTAVVVGVAGLVATVVASYFGARFGASESRRQFGEKSRVERLVAAGELITMIQSFERALQQIIFDISDHRSSSGHAGSIHTNLRSAKLDNGIHARAAVLGVNFVEDTILLAARFARSKNAVSAEWDYGDPEDAVDEVYRWAATLVLDAHAVLVRIADNVDLKLQIQTAMEKKDLIEISGERSDDEYSSVIRRKE